MSSILPFTIFHSYFHLCYSAIMSYIHPTSTKRQAYMSSPVSKNEATILSPRGLIASSGIRIRSSWLWKMQIYIQTFISILFDCLWTRLSTLPSMSHLLWPPITHPLWPPITHPLWPRMTYPLWSPMTHPLWPPITNSLQPFTTV